jgi:Flp pilus assembly protein TadG
MIHPRFSANRKSRSGNVIIEFSLLGIPIILITITIVLVSIGMWQFHCLAYASETTATYASVHGATCAKNGNACTITIGNMATYFASQAIALPQNQVVVSFKDGSGTTTCNPLNTCTSSAAPFPSASYNSVGTDVTVKATYTLKNPIGMFWASTPAQDFTVGATSRQRILF